MSERFRNEIISIVSSCVSREDASRILSRIDQILYMYDISEKQLLPAVIPTLPSEISLYLACRKIEGFSNTTINKYKLRLTIFFTYINKGIKEITTQDIRRFLLEYQMIRHVTNATLDTIRQDLNTFFKWCLSEGYIDYNPCQPISRIKVEKKQKEALTRLEFERVRNVVKFDKRMTAILEFLYSTGCRVSELCNVKISEIDFHSGTVIIHGKGNKQRVDYINDKCKISLEEYLKIRKGSSPYLFVSERSPYQQLTKSAVEKLFKINFKNLSKEFGKSISPHVIRHTMATLSLQGGAKVEEIQRMLGHSSINTTMIYAQVIDDAVREAHKRCVV